MIKKLSLLIIFFVLSFTVLLNIRSGSASAQTPAPAVCASSPSDVAIVIDRSGSMKDSIGSTGTKMSAAKTAARRFVDLLAKNNTNRVGLSSFSTEGTIDRTVTNNYDSVKTEISALVASGDTCTECGIFKGYRNVVDNGRSGVKNVVILLTDGRANVIQGSHTVVGETQAENKALAEAKKSHDNHGTVFFTIGLGNDVNASFLKELASTTGGKYYASPTSTELNSIYDKISQIIAKGAINGVIFNDANNNGVLDTNESNLSGWSVQLVKPGNATESTSTDSNGGYSFGGLCDGSYTVKQTVKSGWKQTLPSGNNYYTLSLSNGNSQTNKNFGNSLIPPTSGPTCVVNPEDISVEPDNGTGIGRPGDELTYTVNVKNNNTNCADATFNLSATILNNTNQGWTYRFDKTSLIIASGQSSSTKLHVTSPSDAVNGPKTITVNVQKTGGAQKTFNTTYNVLAPTPTNTPTPKPTVTPTVTPTPTPTPKPTNTPVPSITFTPPPTNEPGRTIINFVLGIDGIGTTPRIPIGGNKNPNTNWRGLTVKLYNTSTNTLSYELRDWAFNYNSSLGRFESSYDFTSSSLTNGSYNVYVDGPRFLMTQYPGSVSVTQGQTVNLNSNNFYLITGNVNNEDLSENRIDLMDYNLLLSCSIYSQDRSACDQNENNQGYTDLDDDGIVNEDDYTLFLKEFANQQGVILPD